MHCILTVSNSFLLPCRSRSELASDAKKSRPSCGSETVKIGRSVPSRRTFSRLLFTWPTPSPSARRRPVGCRFPRQGRQGSGPGVQGERVAAVNSRTAATPNAISPAVRTSLVEEQRRQVGRARRCRPVAQIYG